MRNQGVAMRIVQYVLLLALPVALSGCAALSGPTITERQAKSGELYARGRDALAGEGQRQGPDYAAAGRYYERAARNGSAEAAYALAALYRDALLTDAGGNEAARDREKTFFWMREAAVGGWPQAQYELAVFYYSGKGTDPDPAESLQWIEKAAENNHILAQRFLGALYLNGADADGQFTVKPDARKGAAWYLRAAYNDDGPSQAVVGALYMTGTGIERDHIQAIKWSRLAAAKGEADAQKRLSALYADQKRQSGYEQAILVQREDFAKGDARAGYTLGRIYYYAPAPYQNPRQAVKLFRETGGKVGASALMMGVACEEGKGAPQNFAEAVEWYRKAVALGQHEAYAYLGSAYLDGRGVPANEESGVAFLRQGAEKGDARSQRCLAVLYTQGTGVPYDYEEALRWSLEAAKGGDIQAMYLAGAMYEKGIGASRSMEDARRLYQHAVDMASADEFVRREDAASWKRDAQKALERLEAEAAAEKTRGEAAANTPEGSRPPEAGPARTGTSQ
jgi:TPR repeat protein